MKTFDEIWEETDKIPGSFTKRSAGALYQAAMSLPVYGYVMELGVDQGRSASILFEAQIDRMYSLYLVDSWPSVLIDNREKVRKLRAKYGGCTNIIRASSAEFAVDGTDGENFWVGPLRDYFNLIHIDAHHFDDTPNAGPSFDCETWMPAIKPGGIACFHDYDSCFPDVNLAVDKFCAGWEDLGLWDGLAIRRKP